MEEEFDLESYEGFDVAPTQRDVDPRCWIVLHFIDKHIDGVPVTNSEIKIGAFRKSSESCQSPSRRFKSWYKFTELQDTEDDKTSTNLYSRVSL